MHVNTQNYFEIVKHVQAAEAELVAVSKTKPVAALQEMYDLGQRDFGENYVQELVEKQAVLPNDIRWHFIGHLQRNKVKYISPFVHLIHGVDTYSLLQEIDKQAKKADRVIDVLLQIHIAQEETKFGFSEPELDAVFHQLVQNGQALANCKIVGLMGMASLTADAVRVKDEFKILKNLFTSYAALKLPVCDLQILSMGMSGDYAMALEEGSNMIRIGSLLFGSR